MKVVEVDFAGKSPFSLAEFSEALDDVGQAFCSLDLTACGLRWNECAKLVKVIDEHRLRGEQA